MQGHTIFSAAMIANRKPNIVPSPAEEVALLQSEKERRRKLRLKQVREQEKKFASQLRQQAKDKKLAELRLLSTSLQSRWVKDHDEKVAYLLARYRDNVQSMGQSHHHAELLHGKLSSVRERKPTAEEQQKAIERHKKALQQLIVEKENRELEKNSRLEARKIALEREKLRAELIAARPLPPDLLMNLYVDKDKTRGKEIEVSFGSSHYHLRRRAERVIQAEQVDARQSALVEEEKLTEMFEEMSRAKDEQLEKARLRHRHALSQLKLEEDRKKLESELHQLERLDKHRRQLEVSKIPVQIFQPPHKRQEDAEQCQRDLELAFEQMYMKETGYTGDLAIALDHRSIIDGPGMNYNSFSSTSTEAEQSTTASINNEGKPTSEESRKIRNQTEQHSIRDEHEQQDHDGTPPEAKAAPPVVDPLKRLLEKIQGQRNRWQTQKESEQVEELSEGTLTTEGTSSVSEPITDPPERFEPSETPTCVPQMRSEPPITLLHPMEIAQRLRTPSSSTVPTLQKSEIPTQEQLKLQLQKQRLHQQQLERQLQQYREHLERMKEPRPISDLDQEALENFKKAGSLKEHAVGGHLQSVEEESERLRPELGRESDEGITAARYDFPLTEISSNSSAVRPSSTDSCSDVQLHEVTARGYSASSEGDTDSRVLTRYPLQSHEGFDKYHKLHLLPKNSSNLISVEQIYNVSYSNSSSSSVTDLSQGNTSGSIMNTSTEKATSLGSPVENSHTISPSSTETGIVSLLSTEVDTLGSSIPKTQYSVRTGSSLYNIPSVRDQIASTRAASVFNSSSSRSSSGVNALSGSNTTSSNLATFDGSSNVSLKSDTRNAFFSGSWTHSGNSLQRHSGSRMLPVNSYNPAPSNTFVAISTNDGFSSVEDKLNTYSTAKPFNVVTQSRDMGGTIRSSSSYSTSVSTANTGSFSFGVSEINNNILSSKSSTGLPSSFSEMSSLGEVPLSSGSLTSYSN